MRKLLILLTFFSFTTIWAQTDLVVRKLNRKPFGGDIYAVHFVDSMIGHAVGINGSILKSFDGGLNWVQTYFPENTDFFDVHFPDYFHGYIVGSQGTVMKTSDGGASWFKLNFPVKEFLRGCHFFDANEGIVIGNNGTMLKTTDGGQSWFAPAFPPSGLWYNEIKFKGDYGIVTNYGGLSMKSYNRGNSWIPFTTSTQHEFSYASEILGVDTFLISGYAIPNNMINITYDGGNSYQEYAPGLITSFTYQMEYDENGNLYIARNGLYMHKIHNDRSSVTYSNQFLQSMQDFQLIHSNKLIGVGSYGQLFIGDSSLYLESRDEGNRNVQAFRQFLTDNILFGMTNDNKIIRSNDGGMSWTDSIPSPSNEDVEFFYIKNDSSYLVYSRFVLYETNDAGLSYDTIRTDPGRFIINVIGKDTLIGYSNSLNILEVSTDCGQTWADIMPSPAYYANGGIANFGKSIFFSETGVNNPRFFRSDDLGTTWHIDTLPNFQGYTNNLRTFFADSLNGFISFSDTSTTTSSMSHYVTTDGGYSWTLDTDFEIDTFLSNVSPASRGDSIIFVRTIYSTNLSRDYRVYHWQSNNNGFNNWVELKTYSRTLWDVERKPNGNIHVAGFNGAYYEFTNDIPLTNSIWPTSDTGDAEILLSGQDLDLVKSARIGNDYINISYLKYDTLIMRIPSGFSGDVYVMTEKDTLNVGYFNSIQLSLESDYLSETNIRIYPNPSHGIYNISNENLSILEIWDSFGRRLQNYDIATMGKIWELDLSKQEAGIYLIRLLDINDNVITKKLIKI